MDNWKRIICDDTENNNKLALEIWNKDVLVCIVRARKLVFIFPYLRKI